MWGAGQPCVAAVRRTVWPVRFCRLFFLFFLPFFERFSQVNLFGKISKKMDPELGAMVTCLGATDHAAEVLGLKTISVTLL
jgi:hypothetical protein